MITFGYKSRFSSILRALAAIAVGLVMVIGNDATTTVVRIIAAFLFAAGVVSLVYGYVHRASGALSLMMTNAIVDMVLGLVLFLSPQLVSGVIVFLVGFVLLAFGVIQLIALIGSVRMLGGGLLPLLLPVLAVVGGIFLLVSPFSIKVMTIVAGCMLVYYGVSELFSAWTVGKAREAYEIQFARERETADGNDGGRIDTSSLSDAKEAEFQKIDE